ncbi:MAG: ATP-binding cassette domain-containing protein, partial [Candidatus Rokuibacteriota bacterium]
MSGDAEQRSAPAEHGRSERRGGMGGHVGAPHAVVLEIDGLSRSFGALAALSKVSFRVHEGQVFSVIGPNGAGKSTLFNVISGLHAPSAGR